MGTGRRGVRTTGVQGTRGIGAFKACRNSCKLSCLQAFWVL